MKVKTILSQLEDVKKISRNQWQALCPAHDDHKPSLSITKAKDGKILLHCFAGCSYEEIIEALSINFNLENKGKTIDEQLNEVFEKYWLPKQKKHPRVERKTTTEYPYPDYEGNYNERVIRVDYPDRPKKIWSQELQGGKWVNRKHKGPIRWLYNGRKVLQHPDQRLYVVEGEPKVEALRKVGLLATCNQGGAGKWYEHHSKDLEGWNEIVILPDNDKAGQRHAHRIKRSSQRHKVKTIRIVALPNLPDGGDVIDYFYQGGTKESLEQIVNNTKPEPLTQDHLVEECFDQIKPKPIQWLWLNHIPLGKVTILAGNMGDGKSTIALDIAARVSTGKKMPDGSVGCRGKVKILSSEDPADDTTRPSALSHIM